MSKYYIITLCFQPPNCPGEAPETFTVNVSYADGSAGCVYPNTLAEPSGGHEVQLLISFVEATCKLVLDEFYDADIIAVNAVGNTSSNGVVKFSECFTIL